MTGHIRVGTSGWQYDDWRGRLYPEGLATGDWLARYVTRFPTVEVNSTFYRLAKRSAVEGWHATAFDDFEFVVKGSRYLTHMKHLNEPAEGVDNFYRPLEPILGQTAVTLWQLPPNWHRNLERLDGFLEVLPSHTRHAVEFRDDDWFHEETYEVLRAHGAANVWLSSSLTEHHELTDTADFVYVRFHGLREDDPYRYDYSRSELEEWAQRLRDVADDGRDAWVFFNNDHEAKAVDNARLLTELLGDAAVTWERSTEPVG